MWKCPFCSRRNRTDAANCYFCRKGINPAEQDKQVEKKIPYKIATAYSTPMAWIDYERSRVTGLVIRAQAALTKKMLEVAQTEDYQHKTIDKTLDDPATADLQTRLRNAQEALGRLKGAKRALDEAMDYLASMEHEGTYGLEVETDD